MPCKLKEAPGGMQEDQIRNLQGEITEAEGMQKQQVHLWVQNQDQRLSHGCYIWYKSEESFLK